jgi:hypothetical protein
LTASIKQLEKFLNLFMPKQSCGILSESQVTNNFD